MQEYDKMRLIKCLSIRILSADVRGALLLGLTIAVAISAMISCCCHPPCCCSRGDLGVQSLVVGINWWRFSIATSLGCGRGKHWLEGHFTLTQAFPLLKLSMFLYFWIKWLYNSLMVSYRSHAGVQVRDR